ncbi:MAG TPA: EVE domain-containing protein [Phycisphaerae bacterium]|nr:EVE domain-containing protein [Phycisphaerales bacterium]HRX84498.1 EVE domain-containing protein [Phycisphaerae bacterium]
MNHWLLKTEPEEYAYADLERQRRGVWDGVRNNWALQHLRGMRRGDLAFIYHTGKERRIVGIAEVVRAAYPDPQADDPKWVVVDLVAKCSLPTPVSLKTIKADPHFAELLLVRSTRLSVMPVTAAHWKALCKLGGLSAKRAATDGS